MDDLNLLQPHGGRKFGLDTDFDELLDAAPELAERLDERYETFNAAETSGLSVAEVAKALGKSPEEFVKELYEILSGP